MSFQDGDTVQCGVTPDDGLSMGTSRVASVVVGGLPANACTSVTLDGLSGWVSIPSTNFTTVEWTFEAWIDMDWTVGGGYLFHTPCHAISYNTNGSLSAYQFPGCNGTGTRKVARDQTLDMNALPRGWQHFAVSSSGSQVRFYVNGVQIGNANYQSQSVSTVSGGGLGAKTDGGIPTGFVAVAFSDVRLSEAELYTGSSFSVVSGSQPSSDAVLHYTFEGQNGTLVSDQINSNNGQLMGAGAAWSTTCETQDLDGDTVLAWEDCDDSDNTSTSRVDDGDCDGVPATNDCDDANPGLGDQSFDADCDGVVTSQDCDDNDPNISVNCGGGGATIIEVVSGRYHSCALDQNGEVYCWGAPQGSAADFGQVTNVPQSNSFVQIDSGTDHMCGLESTGAVSCWGDNSEGQVSGSPELQGTYSNLGAGYSHTCGVDTTGKVRCWGNDDDGQVSGKPSGTGYDEVVSGDGFSCALDDTGAVSCWGDNSYGQESVPQGTYRAISAGDHHICGVTMNDAVACWGDDSDNKVADAPTSAQVLISAGANHTCAINANGAVVCWGADDAGQSTVPGAGALEASLVGAGTGHTCVLNAKGELECWGDDTYEQASPPSTSMGYVAVSAGGTNSCSIDVDDALSCWGDPGFGINAPPSGAFIQVSVGNHHACGLTDTGDIDCWGIDSSALNNYFDQDDYPTGSYIELSAGANHSCAISSSQQIDCWGRDDANQVTNAPTDSGYTQVAAGGAFACALKSGQVSCWGSDSDGQRTGAPTSTGHTDLTAGVSHACVLSSGTPVCWGDISSFSPPSGVAFETLAAGGTVTCGLEADGTLHCWGMPGSLIMTQMPVSLLFQRIELGSAHGCGVTVDGARECWGQDTNGESSPP